VLAWLWGLAYPVAEVLAWGLVEPVYLLPADLTAWEYRWRMGWAVLVYPSPVERAVSAYPPGVRWVALAHPPFEQME
jgi:hypothetical protein